jgi:hypothetical protein
MKFTFQKRWYGPDGDKMLGGAYNPDVVKESHTFYTVHDAIRFVESVKRPGRTDYWIAWSLENESMTQWRLTDRNLWNVLARVHQRYQRFCFYIHSVKDWETVPNSRVYYADNSVEETERNRVTGATRRKMVEYPHGDLC